MSKKFFSTGTFESNMSLLSRVDFLVNRGVKAIELSGGGVEPNWRSIISKFPEVDFSFHNYFPAPTIPFTLNLSSSDPEIRFKSVDFCKNGVRLAAEFGHNQFSFHAGFCFDPIPESLGAELKSKFLPQDHASAYDFFRRSLDEIVEFAREQKVLPLVENNVLTSKTASKWGQRSLLLTGLEEVELISVQYGKALGFLLDVGHLAVSCTTLARDFSTELSGFLSHANALHIHSNNGVEDQHLGVDGTEDWWPMIRRCQGLPWTFEVRPEDVKQTIILLGQL